jgi:hypothetical protein
VSEESVDDLEDKVAPLNPNNIINLEEEEKEKTPEFQKNE